MEIRESIRGHIDQNLLFGDDSSPAGDSIPLLDNGIIDAIGVRGLVAFPEKGHGLAINDEDLVPGNLHWIDNLVGFGSRERIVV